MNKDGFGSSIGCKCVLKERGYVHVLLLFSFCVSWGLVTGCWWPKCKEDKLLAIAKENGVISWQRISTLW